MLHFDSITHARDAVRLGRLCHEVMASQISGTNVVTLTLSDCSAALENYFGNSQPLLENLLNAARASLKTFVNVTELRGLTYPYRHICARHGGRWFSHADHRGRGFSFPYAQDASLALEAILANPAPAPEKPGKLRRFPQPQPEAPAPVNPQPQPEAPAPSPEAPTPENQPMPEAINPAQDPAQALAQALQALLAAQKGQIDPTIIEALEARLQALEARGDQAPLRIEIQDPNGEVRKLEGSHHYRLPGLIKLTQALRANRVPDPICLVGPAGTGKTHAAHALAQALGIPFHTTSIGPATMESRLIGYMDAMGKMVRTPIREAVEFGGVCLIDEFDAGSPQSLLVLNALTANSHIGFADGVIERHKDLVVIFAANTYGRGACDGYKRSAQDRALLDRIAWYEWPIDPSMELESMAGGDARVMAYIGAVRSALQTAQADVYLSPRATRRFAALVHEGYSASDAREIAFGYSGMQADVQQVIDRVKF